MVVFEDGLPRGRSRRFVIRSVDGQNDVAAMHEVITRRFRRMLDDQRATAAAGAADATDPEGPLLIDPTTGAPRRFACAGSGGGGRWPAAGRRRGRRSGQLGIHDVALCGLAKRLEEVWVPDSDVPGDPAPDQ